MRASTFKDTPRRLNAATWTRFVADFSEELQPQVPEIAKVSPQPVTSAEVLSLEVGDDESVALIRYSGETGEVRIRSRWQNQGVRPVVVGAELAA